MFFPIPFGVCPLDPFDITYSYLTRAGVLYVGHFFSSSAQVRKIKAVRGTVASKHFQQLNGLSVPLMVRPVPLTGPSVPLAEGSVKPLQNSAKQFSVNFCRNDLLTRGQSTQIGQLLIAPSCYRAYEF